MFAWLVGCDVGPAKLTEVRESEHFRIRSEPGDPEVCDETLDEFERNREILSRFFGHQPPEFIDYYKFVDVLEGAPCEGDMRCTDGTKIYTNEPVHVHELVHSYLSNLGDHSFFTGEGLADAIDCNAEDIGPWVPLEGGWEDARPEADPYESYPIARTLVAHLMRRFGPLRTLEWHLATPAQATNEQLRETFAATFDADIDDEFARALEGPSCTNVVECAGKELPLDPESDPSLVPPLDFRTSGCSGRVPTYTTTVEEPSWLLWSSTDASRLHLLGCIAGPDDVAPTPHPLSTYTIGARRGFFLLPPGKYAFLSQPTRAIRAWREDGAFASTDCSAAVQHEAEAPGDALEFFLPGDERPQFIRLAPVPEGAGMPRISVGGRSLYARVSACRSCSDEDCVPLNEGDAFRTELPEWSGWTLRVEDARANLGVTLLVHY